MSGLVQSKSVQHSTAGLIAVTRSNSMAGIGLTLISIVLFSGSNALAKWVFASVPVGETLFMRGIIATMLIAPFIRVRELREMRHGGQLGLHLLRVGCSAIEIGCFYWSITGLPLANATTIYLAGPIYVTAMAAYFLGETVTWRQIAAVTLGFAGVLVAMQPQAQSFDLHAVAALVGSLLYAISLVATRGLRRTPNTLLVGSQMAALALVSLATMPLGWVIPSTMQAMQMLTIGLVGVIAYACVNRGLQLAPASVVAPFNYGSIIGATVLGFLVFDDIPSTATLAGAAIVIAAGGLVLAGERIK